MPTRAARGALAGITKLYPVLRLLGSALLVCGLLAPSTAFAKRRDYTVRWMPMQHDGIASYELSMGGAALSYTTSIDLGLPPLDNGMMSARVEIDDSADLHVVVRAKGVDDLYSAYSNEILVPKAPPASVGILASSAGEISILDIDGGVTPLTTEPDATLGDVRPTWCDLDADGEDDLLIGFGPGGNGHVVGLLLRNRRIVDRIELDVGADPVFLSRRNWTTYANRNGETYPACGDIDGDGRNEVVVGLGPGSASKVHIFDDFTTGHAESFHTKSTLDPIRFAGVYRIDGSAVPALGDIDGDGIDEIVIGRNTGGGATLSIYDDATTDYAPLRGEVPADVIAVPGSDLTDGAIWPAVADFDRDGRAELVVGLGVGGAGRVFFIDDQASDFALLPSTDNPDGSAQVGYAAYNQMNGSVVPSVADIDDDGEVEVGLGLGAGGEGFLQVLECQPAQCQVSPSWGDADGLVDSGIGLLVYPALNR